MSDSDVMVSSVLSSRDHGLEHLLRMNLLTMRGRRAAIRRAPQPVFAPTAFSDEDEDNDDDGDRDDVQVDADDRGREEVST